MSKLNSSLSGLKPSGSAMTAVAALGLSDADQTTVATAIDAAVADAQSRATLNLAQAARLYAWVCQQDDPQAAVDAITQA